MCQHTNHESLGTIQNEHLSLNLLRANDFVANAIREKLKLREGKQQGYNKA